MDTQHEHSSPRHHLTIDVERTRNWRSSGRSVFWWRPGAAFVFRAVAYCCGHVSALLVVIMAWGVQDHRAGNTKYRKWVSDHVVQGSIRASGSPSSAFEVCVIYVNVGIASSKSSSIFNAQSPRKSALLVGPIYDAIIQCS